MKNTGSNYIYYTLDCFYGYYINYMLIVLELHYKPPVDISSFQTSFNTSSKPTGVLHGSISNTQR
jgi:hypothetical protein